MKANLPVFMYVHMNHIPKSGYFFPGIMAGSSSQERGISRRVASEKVLSTEPHHRTHQPIFFREITEKLVSLYLTVARAA